MSTSTASGRASEHYVLRLFIAGTTVRSTRAIEAMRALCDDHLEGRHELEVIDVYQQPQVALDEQIIAVPALVKCSPAPKRRLVGDLSDANAVLRGLDLIGTPDEEKRRPSK